MLRCCGQREAGIRLDDEIWFLVVQQIRTTQAEEAEPSVRLSLCQSQDLPGMVSSYYPTVFVRILN